MKTKPPRAGGPIPIFRNAKVYTEADVVERLEQALFRARIGHHHLQRRAVRDALWLGFAAGALACGVVLELVRWAVGL